MNCPKCNGKSKVICSRYDCNNVARHRKCKECGYIFYTVESSTNTSHAYFNRLDKDYRKELENE